MRTILGITLLLGAFGVGAVHVNPNGTGQVLIFPVYFADGGFDTLISVTNETSRRKAVKFRALEGLAGHDTLTFNIYLGPHDTWTGVITRQSGVAVLRSNDDTCTVPTIPEPGQPFTNLLFSNDPAPDDIGRTLLGHLEFIEMGELILTARDLVDAGDCDGLVEAWTDGGFWDQGRSTDMLPPTGGLSGNGWLVNVAQGQAHGFEAVALENFADSQIHFNPGALEPDLTFASPGPSSSRTVASVATDDGMVDLAFDQPIDAVSAALTASVVATDFVLEEAVQGQTVTYLTAPTFRHYVLDFYRPTSGGGPFMPPPGLPRAPYTALFGANGAPTPIQLDIVNRDGEMLESCERINLQLPPSGIAGPVDLLASVNPIVFSNEVGFSMPSRSNRIRPETPAGRAAFVLGPDAGTWATCSNDVNVFSRVSARATVLNGERAGEQVRVSGLPVIGLTFSTVVNGTLTDDSGQAVLSNYGVTHKLRRKVELVNP